MAKKNPSPTRGKNEAKTDEKAKTSPRDDLDRPARGDRRLKTDEKAKTSPRDSVREMIESVVIAFVLAFLFRTFEAEAFVIPTGSMAPTLMGQHKDLVCSNCGYSYRVSASEEEPRDGRPPQFVTASICPVCRYQMDFGPGGRDAGVRHATFKGDRILVAKFTYEFSEPKRWDVAVFKNPGKAKENYIKRVVGLPNETVVVCHGDIHTTQDELDDIPLDATAVAEMQRQGTLKIERKPPVKVEAMLQVVHDNNYLPPRMPLRWEPQTPGWETLDDGKAFACDGKATGDALLLYNHLLPSPEIWQRLEDKPNLRLSNDELRPQLITDFYAYNTSESQVRYPVNKSVFGNHWVGDLAVDCRAEIVGREGELILQLVEGGNVFECRIDVATGTARFVVPGDAAEKREAQTPIHGPGTYDLRFANVDDQLLLWIDGKLLDADGRYGPLGPPVPDINDLMPVRLGSNGMAVRFAELRVLRDVYYIAVDRNNAENAEAGTPRPGNFFYDQTQWQVLAHAPAIELDLSGDRFMVCGDNSPRSFDSRMWNALDEEGGVEYYVKRELLVGKAVYIYWPHALDHLPGTDIWFPFFPNFGRMGFVR